MQAWVVIRISSDWLLQTAPPRLKKSPYKKGLTQIDSARISRSSIRDPIQALLQPARLQVLVHHFHVQLHFVLQ